ncbi:MAG TPA: Calx-beta domain-containing protein [Tepidisphaeraceae bacterium]|nr:Calx-beta domain-containing protein [Tepidisphaeraceae bacterium]
MRKNKNRRSKRSANSAVRFGGVESLESRRLLAASTISVLATFPNASETSPTRTGRGELLFSRTGGSFASPLVVHYALNNTSTATSGADFQALSGVATIPAGKKSVAVNVIPVDDAIHENTEKVVVKITANSAYKIGTSTATVNIADNDPVNIPTTVGVYATFYNASETSPHRTGRGEFLFSRVTGATNQPLALQYYVRNTSTASSNDYEALSGTVTIPAGKRSAAVNLFPIDDATVESAETVIAVVKDSPNYTIVHRTATVTIADNDVAPSNDWFDNTRRYRKAIDISSGSFARNNQPVDNTINFTDILDDLGTSGSLVANSIRVIEVSADGHTQIDGNVPFQFDHDSNFDASSQASGDLIILTKGATAANATRHYQVYFDTTGSFSAPSFTALVTTDANSSDQGQAAIKIDTQNATYWLQKENGGFSSIEDKSAQHNDWLGFDPAGGSGSAGEFRGTPNAVFPGGGFHPGFTTGATTATVLVNSGPLKTTIETTLSVDKQISGGPFTYKMRYEIYPTFVRATMVQADDSYWFLYEGTPGGSATGSSNSSADPNDTVFRSDGTSDNIGTEWHDDDGLGNGSDAADSDGEEWVYFRDSAVNKFIYFVHNDSDDLEDSSHFQNDPNSVNGGMTVFGFGRDNETVDPNREKMTAQNNTFTFGLADGGGVFSDSKTLIDGVYHDVSVSLGSSDIRPS